MGISTCCTGDLHAADRARQRSHRFLAVPPSYLPRQHLNAGMFKIVANRFDSTAQLLR